jgi:hypothetical protein
MRVAESPFEHNHADPWAKQFVDLGRLNAGASDAIVEAIAHVRERAREDLAELRAKSLLVLGPAGAGKTHLFARLRKKLGPRAIFVHLRPLLGAEMTPRYVLDQIVTQLAYDTAQPILDAAPALAQVDALVAGALAHLKDDPPDMPRAFLDGCLDLDRKKLDELLEWATERVLDRYPEVDEMVLRRLLGVPFMAKSERRAALAWLSGRELEESQLARLRVTSGLSEERVVPALRTLAVTAAAGAPIVLVFDQLENLVDREATGGRVRSFGNLVAELFDSMRGFVLVSMALDTEWSQAMLPELSQAQRTRIAERTELLELPSLDDRRELVRLWTEQLPPQPEPFPWPFGEGRLRAWCEAPGMTPRMLMIACRDALAAGPEAGDEHLADAGPPTEPSAAPDAEADLASALAQAWEKHVAKAREELDRAGEDRRAAAPARLLGGLAAAAGFVPELRVTKLDPHKASELVLKAGEREVRVCYLHHGHPRSALAAIERAREAAGKTAVVLVRERALDFPPTWKKVSAAQADAAARGARWHTLDRDEVTTLLALESFLAAARSRDLEGRTGRALEEGEVLPWVQGTRALAELPLFERVALAAQASPNASTAAPPSTPSSPEDDPGPLFAASRDAREPAAQRAAPSAPSTPSAPSAEPDAPAGDLGPMLVAILARLRIASLERLVREAERARAATTRSAVLAALGRLGGRVRWFGRAIVGVGRER